MKYCKDALKLLGIKVECGSDCPILTKCPRAILEDAVDEAINKAMEAMMEVMHENRHKGINKI